MDKMEPFADYLTPLQLCPNCGEKLDGLMSPTGGRGPQANDLSVCAYCATILVFDSATELHELPPEDWSLLPIDTRKELKRYIQAIRLAHDELRKKKETR